MRHAFSFSLAFLVLVSFSCGQISGQSKSVSFQEGMNAYFQMNHTKAYTIFSNVWNDKGQTEKDRVQAGRFLATMDWLLYRKNAKAHGMLKELEKIDFEQSQLQILKARVLEDEEKFDKAIAAAQKAIDVSSSESESYRALMVYCQHVLGRYKHQLLKGEKSSSDDISEVKEAYATLGKLIDEQSGDVKLANIYLGYSLLLRQGSEAFNAWLTFFRLTDISEVHPSLMKSVGTFQSALAGYRPGVENSRSVSTIIKGLAESGFHEYAVLLKLKEFGSASHSDNRINDIIKYQGFLKRVEQTAIDFYWQTVDGVTGIYDFNKGFLADAEDLWDKLDWEDGTPSFSQKVFIQKMEERFKAIITFINANGYYGLHMGHKVLDDRRVISQYDKSAEFRYISIDHMVSNGYSGWFWDGLSQTGGWARNDEAFLQVRSAYTNGPVEMWRGINDPIAAKKFRDEMKELSKKDDDLAKEDPHAFLPGLARRVVYKGTIELLDSLKSTGLEKKDLRLSFINTLEKIIQGSSIYAHEGRHSIDKKNGYSRVSAELEYTAKLSEIYFSMKPRMSLRAILAPNMGDGTSHGIANLRVVKGLVSWMDKHKKEIVGFESSRPTLPQLDKLTAQQLKRAVRSLDPMAN